MPSHPSLALDFSSLALDFPSSALTLISNFYTLNPNQASINRLDTELAAFQLDYPPVLVKQVCTSIEKSTALGLLLYTLKSRDR